MSGAQRATTVVGTLAVATIGGAVGNSLRLSPGVVAVLVGLLVAVATVASYAPGGFLRRHAQYGWLSLSAGVVSLLLPALVLAAWNADDLVVMVALGLTSATIAMVLLVAGIGVRWDVAAVAVTCQLAGVIMAGDALSQLLERWSVAASGTFVLPPIPYPDELLNILDIARIASGLLCVLVGMAVLARPRGPSWSIGIALIVLAGLAMTARFDDPRILVSILTPYAFGLISIVVLLTAREDLIVLLLGVSSATFSVGGLVLAGIQQILWYGVPIWGASAIAVGIAVGAITVSLLALMKPVATLGYAASTLAVGATFILMSVGWHLDGSNIWSATALLAGFASIAVTVAALLSIDSVSAAALAARSFLFTRTASRE